MWSQPCRANQLFFVLFWQNKSVYFSHDTTQHHEISLWHDSFRSTTTETGCDDSGPVNTNQEDDIGKYTCNIGIYNFIRRTLYESGIYHVFSVPIGDFSLAW